MGSMKRSKQRQIGDAFREERGGGWLGRRVGKRPI